MPSQLDYSHGSKLFPTYCTVLRVPFNQTYCRWFPNVLQKPPLVHFSLSDLKRLPMIRNVPQVYPTKNISCAIFLASELKIALFILLTFRR